MKKESVSPFKHSVAKGLVRKAFILAGVDLADTNKAFAQMSRTIEEQAGVRISTKSIRELYNSQPSDFDEYSFSITKSKEVLAAYVLLKEGYIKDKTHIKLKPDSMRKHRTIEHNIYFNKYLSINSVANSKDNRAQHTTHDDLSVVENKIPDHLINSTWRLYNSDEDEQIYGHILKINHYQSNNLTSCEIINADKEYQDYEGWVGLDGTLSYLIFNLVNKSTRQKYLQMMWRLPMGLKPTITLGIVTYISSSRNKLTASIIFLERLESNANENTIIDSDKTPVPLEVKKLFALNRIRLLTLPDKTAVNFEELRKWLESEEKSRRSNLLIDEILLSYCQEYWIYYLWEDYYNKKLISKAEFEIYFSQESQQILGKINVSERGKYDNGSINMNGSFISAFFLKPINLGLNASTVYLVFKVGEQFIPDSMECFIGIITGLSEQHESAVSYLALVIPKRFKDIDDEWLIKYFSDKEWRIETFDHKGFKFDNL